MTTHVRHGPSSSAAVITSLDQLAFHFFLYPVGQVGLVLVTFLTNLAFTQVIVISLVRGVGETLGFATGTTFS
jgi:hypothetical protein